MNIKELKKELNGVFKLPVKVRYFGKAIHGTPYFFPRNYVDSIIKVRKLTLKTDEEIAEYAKRYPHLAKVDYRKDERVFNGIPMVKRSRHKIIRLFGNYYWVEWGWPISFYKVNLGWKDKWESPRFEWPPQFSIYFFGLQYSVWWVAPRLDGEKYSNNDKYYEMILWYLNYKDKDIKKSEKEWGWVNSETNESTWDKKYLI